MTPVWPELRLFLVALQFLTRVPVPAGMGWNPQWLHDSARHFPGVGALVGGAAAVVLWAAAHFFSAPVAVLLSMAATIWMTGAFHEDGLADTCDGLGGAVTRDRALAIMKDSRLGTYGAVGLLLVLALKAATLHSLATRDLAVTLATLPLAHAASRAGTVALLRFMPYGGDIEHAKAKPLAQRISAAGLGLAWGFVAAVIAALALVEPPWLAPLGVATGCVAIGTWACARWLRGRLGGYTGDTLGATQQITELLALLGMLAWQGSALV